MKESCTYNKSEETSNTPHLRFPGFTGEWKEKKLGEVCENILVGFPFKGEDITDDSSGQPILRAYSIGDGIIKHGKDYDKFYPHNSTILDKYRVREGDIVISMDGSVGKNIALVSEKEKDYLLIQRVARLRIQKHPIQLVYQQVKSQRFKDFANSEKVGAVIAHISQKQIEAFPILLPPTLAEQQKIADCLSSLDDMISAEGQKTEALREYKRGLMQQLFPANGASTPQLRFPEFTGEWKEKMVGEVSVNEDFKRQPVSKMERVAGQYPYYGANGVQDYVDGFIFEGERLLVGEDGSVLTKDNTPVLSWAEGKFWVNNHAHVLAQKGEFPLKYLYYSLSTQKISGLVTGIPPKLNQENLNNIKISCPPSPAEQQKIADCLSSLDDMISAQAQKTEALREYKRGLMQQLFPQPSK